MKNGYQLARVSFPEVFSLWTNLEIGDLVSKGYPSIHRRLCPTVTDPLSKVQLNGGQSLITQPVCFPETMQPEEL